jgi:predicted  nucleic acid-binding Zn-ribbon protein
MTEYCDYCGIDLNQEEDDEIVREDGKTMCPHCGDAYQAGKAFVCRLF